MRVRKKTVALLLVLAAGLGVCAGCAGEEKTEPTGIYYEITGIDPKETVMESAGNEVPAELYCYFLGYTCSSLEYQVGMYNAYYGMYGELLNEDGTINWTASLSDDQTISQLAKEQAEKTVKFNTAMENMAAANGVSITEEDRAALEEDRASLVEQLGSEEKFTAYLEKMGVSLETFDRITQEEYLFDHLTDLVMEEGSPLYLAPEGYDQYATYADHILLSTVDSSTNEALSEEEIAKKKAMAEAILAQLEASDDAVALFAELADTYSEDPGRASNPSGYIYTPGTMVTEFEDAASALQPGEFSGIVESAYGYHIILRRDLQEALEADAEQKASLAAEHLNTLIQEEVDKEEMSVSEKLNGIDAGKFYTAYNEKLDAIEAAEAESETGTGTESTTDETNGQE